MLKYPVLPFFPYIPYHLQIEKCKTDYIKECHISYEIKAKPVKVETCKENFIRDCDDQGEEICTMEEDASM